MKGYYNAIFAIVGMACLGLAGMVTLSPQPKIQRDTAQSASEYTGKQIDKSENRTLVGQGISATSSEENLPKSTENESYYNREDLKAQESMAQWTRNMGIAAYFGIFLSTIGVGLIFATFFQTQKAAKSAQGTVDAYIAVERSRLVASASDPKFVEGRPVCIINITNIGKTDCLVYLASAWWKDDAAWNADPVTIGSPKNIVVKSSQAKHLLHTVGSPKGENFVHGYVKYKSPLSDDHRTYFSFEITRNAGGDIIIIENRPKGRPDDT